MIYRRLVGERLELCTASEWMAWSAAIAERRVGLTVFPQGQVVSTVCLPGPALDRDDPTYTLPFETMAFEHWTEDGVGPALHHLTRRAPSYGAARRHHHAAVAAVAAQTAQVIPA